MNNVLSMRANDPIEIVTYAWTPITNVKPLIPVLDIRLDSTVFKSSGSPFEVNNEMRKQQGHILKLFFNILEKTQPIYASLGELYDPLPNPHAIAQDAIGAFSFSEMYYAVDYFNNSTIVELKRLYEGAYIRPIANGFYASTLPILNPDNIHHITSRKKIASLLKNFFLENI